MPKKTTATQPSTSKPTQRKVVMSPEARAKISAAAKKMHAARKAAKQAGGKAAELRVVADILDQANRLSPQGLSYLKTLL